VFVVVLQNPSVMTVCVVVIDNNALLFLTLVMFMVVAMMKGHAKLCRQGGRGRQGGQQLYSFAVTGIDRVIKVVSTYCATARQDRALDITNANEA